MEFDSTFNILFKAREGFENFNKTYKGKWFGSVIDDDHEYLMLIDRRYKLGFKKCILPATALNFIYLGKPKRGDYIKVKLKCDVKDDILRVEMLWALRNKKYGVKYKMFVHPKSLEQFRCYIIN